MPHKLYQILVLCGVNMSEFQPSASHNIVLKDRNHISVCGIKGVNGFSEELISIVTSSDELLYIEGREMNVEEINLDKGTVEASGTVTAIIYEDKFVNGSKKNGFFKGLFVR